MAPGYPPGLGFPVDDGDGDGDDDIDVTQNITIRLLIYRPTPAPPPPRARHSSRSNSRNGSFGRTLRPRPRPRPGPKFEFTLSRESLSSRPGETVRPGVPPGFGFPLLPNLSPERMSARRGATLPPILSLLGRARPSSSTVPSISITLPSETTMTRIPRHQPYPSSSKFPFQRQLDTLEIPSWSHDGFDGPGADPQWPPFPPVSQTVQHHNDSVVAQSQIGITAQGANYREFPANPQSPYSNKRLNVESPAFTPLSLPPLPALAVPGRATTISSQAANAAPFTPRGLTGGSVTANNHAEPEPTAFNPASIREFTPQNTHIPPTYDIPHNLTTNGNATENSVPFDPFSMSTLNSAMPPTQYNPYLEDTNNMAANQSTYYQSQPAFGAPQQPLQYHLYAPMGPHRDDLLPYQRLSHDFFIPNDLREELQKKSEATRQVLEVTRNTLPLPTVDQYHTLVALDTRQDRSATVFGYPSWAYKATSSKNGHTYLLRRLEGFRLSNDKPMKSVKEWKRVDNSGVVSVIDAFTSRDFGDSSFIFVYNYHPLSKTLAEHHFTPPNRYGNRQANTTVPEHQLWAYIIQLASAIKAVHDAKLAVRCMDPSKVLLTGKGRIRLNACGVLDVVRFEENRPLPELQQEDFILFARLIVAIATSNLSVYSSAAPIKGPIDQLARTYSQEFRNTIDWLLSPVMPDDPPKDINVLLSGISSHVVSALDSSLHANDTLTSTLSAELENGRIVRLLCKLGTINERPEYEHDVKWSEVGERYMLKLFRDHVFHQVDANGKPVVELGHILTNLNKLDAGTGQMIKLCSRDEQTIFFVTYKELKKQVEAAWGDLAKGTAGGGGKRF